MVARAGSGWPDDPADADTPVAHTPDDVRHLAAGANGLAAVSACSSVCRACPRLVEWRERVAVEKRRAFADQPYWGRPVPGFGAERPRVLIVGLAPAAHGGNRTGRLFTGDRSGDWLFAALYRVGLATQPTSVTAGDGLRLIDTRIMAPVRCAPPANKPTPQERDACGAWFTREVELVWPSVRAVVALGAFAWDATWRAVRMLGLGAGDHSSRVGVADHASGAAARVPRFGHGVVGDVDGRRVLGCYHVSQQNTFTGRLTEPMLVAVLREAAASGT